MSTPHNSANKGDIAKTVLMPGDPLRAKFIAETFLTDVKQFNEVRNMFGYTGKYNGKEVSVMGSGMGMPSIGIYSYELYSMYGVENIIRIGSAGSYCEEAGVFDVVLANAAYSESSYAKTQSGYDKDITYPSEVLNYKIRKSAIHQMYFIEKIKLLIIRIYMKKKAVYVLRWRALRYSIMHQS